MIDDDDAEEEDDDDDDEEDDDEAAEEEPLDGLISGFIADSNRALGNATARSSKENIDAIIVRLGSSFVRRTSPILKDARIHARVARITPTVEGKCVSLETRAMLLFSPIFLRRHCIVFLSCR